jgi:hypothetical protein
MHKFAYRVFGILAAGLIVPVALAQSTRPLDNLSACRLDEARIALRFTFEGGACQEAGEASLLPADGANGNVTEPTENVGEVCTMQIVPVGFEGVVDATEEIVSLDITVLSPEGRPQALGSMDIIDDEGKECVEPETEEATE